MAARKKPSSAPVPPPVAPLHPRGETVVQAVLEATVEELARVGYGALRFEDVAARAGVAKTTIYRRWPTKRELVEDSLGTIAEGVLTPPETGHLRTDLLALARTMVVVLTSAHGQAIMRMLMAEGDDPELLSITRCLREDTAAPPRHIIERAIARGELAPGKHGELLLETMMGAIHHQLFLLREVPDEDTLVRLVDLLLDGALALRTSPSPKTRART
jgi:AcrR family transcriptional regulator